MGDLALVGPVKETSQTTGTGAYVLDGAVAWCERFIDAVSAGTSVPYYAWSTTDYESGIGTVSAPNGLSRDVIIKSSNANEAVDWPAGTKDVLIAELPVPRYATHTVTGETTLGYHHSVVYANNSSAAPVHLPDVTKFQGHEFTISRVGTGLPTVDTYSTQEVRDPTFGFLQEVPLFILNDSLTIIGEGNFWQVTERNFAPHRGELVREFEQSVTSGGSFQSANFDKVTVEAGMTASLVTYSLTIARTNRYRVRADWGYNVGANKQTAISVQRSGGTSGELGFIRASLPIAATCNAITEREVDLTEGDVIVASLYQDSGSTINTLTSAVGRPTLQVREML